MSEIIHSFGHGSGAAGPGARIDLEPGRYRVVSSDPGVKVQHRTSIDDDTEETVTVNGHGGRRREYLTRPVPGAEHFEDFTKAGASFVVKEPTVFRLVYGEDGSTTEIHKE
jgi:hypothetical protein